jgi:hypothetical protein
MVLSNPSLHDALMTFELAPSEAPLSFTRRLAGENGWTSAMADRVVHEYRRFVYLCAVAGRPMTPSDAVDQAWHLHLTYTRSYWAELCERLLKRPLHHEPTRGGAGERERFRTQYEDTLATYEREFDQAPPADIWPDSATRFAARYARINLREHWVIRKPAARLTWLALALACAPATLGCAGATAAEVGMAGENKDWSAILYGVGGPAIILVLLMVFAGRDRLRHRRARRARLMLGIYGGHLAGGHLDHGHGCGSSCGSGCGGGGGGCGGGCGS